MYKFSKNSVDLNSIIKIANLTVFVTTIYIYIFKLETNPYIDFTTLILLGMLSLQIHLILMFERRNRDPFVLLLALNITFFYLLRILTLAYIPWSDVLGRYALTVDDINITLLYIFFGIWSIFFGFTFVKFKILPTKENSKAQRNKRINPKTIILIFIFTLIAGFYFIFWAGLGRTSFLEVSRLDSYINMIINHDVIIILTFTYITTNLKIIPRKYLFSIFILVIIYILFRIFSGSRGGMITLIMAALFVLLAAKNKVSLNKSALFLIILIIIPVSMMTFDFATYTRSALNSQQAEKIAIENFSSSLLSYQIDKTDGLVSILRPVFSRIGFLDMATDIVSNSNKYDRVINFEYYLKSVIDRIGITPGFHVFNVYLATNTLPYIYNNMDIPMIMESYNSDQFTIFGEYYLLFKGYGSLIVLFAMAYIFKILYLSIKTRDTFSLCFYRAIFLYIFYNFWLNSFGMDKLIVETPRIILSSIIFMQIAKIDAIRLNNKSSKAFT